MYQTNIIEADHLPHGTVTVASDGKYMLTLVTGHSTKLVLVLPVPAMKQLMTQIAECTDIVLNDKTSLQ